MKKQLVECYVYLIVRLFQLQATTYSKFSFSKVFCIIRSNSCTSMCFLFTQSTHTFCFQVVRGAGHHVYADKPEPFNKLILRICEAVDNNTNPKPIKFRESFKASNDSSSHTSKTITESKSSKSLVVEDTPDDEDKENVPTQVLQHCLVLNSQLLHLIL